MLHHCTIPFDICHNSSTNNPLERCNRVKEFAETNHNIHDRNGILLVFSSRNKTEEIQSFPHTTLSV